MASLPLELRQIVAHATRWRDQVLARSRFPLIRLDRPSLSRLHKHTQARVALADDLPDRWHTSEHFGEGREPSAALFEPLDAFEELAMSGPSTPAASRLPVTESAAFVVSQARTTQRAGDQPEGAVVARAILRLLPSDPESADHLRREAIRQGVELPTSPGFSRFCFSRLEDNKDLHSYLEWLPLVPPVDPTASSQADRARFVHHVGTITRHWPADRDSHMRLFRILLCKGRGAVDAAELLLGHLVTGQRRSTFTLLSQRLQVWASHRTRRDLQKVLARQAAQRGWMSLTAKIMRSARVSLRFKHSVLGLSGEELFDGPVAATDSPLSLQGRGGSSDSSHAEAASMNGGHSTASRDSSTLSRLSRAADRSAPGEDNVENALQSLNRELRKLGARQTSSVRIARVIQRAFTAGWSEAAICEVGLAGVPTTAAISAFAHALMIAYLESSESSDPALSTFVRYFEPTGMALRWLPHEEPRQRAHNATSLSKLCRMERLTPTRRVLATAYEAVLREQDTVSAVYESFLSENYGTGGNPVQISQAPDQDLLFDVFARHLMSRYDVAAALRVAMQSRDYLGSADPKIWASIAEMSALAAIQKNVRCGWDGVQRANLALAILERMHVYHPDGPPFPPQSDRAVGCSEDGQARAMSFNMRPRFDELLPVVLPRADLTAYMRVETAFREARLIRQAHRVWRLRRQRWGWLERRESRLGCYEEDRWELGSAAFGDRGHLHRR